MGENEYKKNKIIIFLFHLQKSLTVNQKYNDEANISSNNQQGRMKVMGCERTNKLKFLRKFI